MRKASKILCLIGGILGIVLALVWIILGIVYFVFGGLAAAVAAGTGTWADLPQSVQDLFTRLIEQQGFTNMEQLATYLFGEAILFLVMFLFSIPSAVISFILAKKEKTGLPLPIVLVVLSWAGNIPSVVGGVLAIVNWAVVERKEQ